MNENETRLFEWFMCKFSVLWENCWAMKLWWFVSYFLNEDYQFSSINSWVASHQTEAFNSFNVSQSDSQSVLRRSAKHY